MKQVFILTRELAYDGGSQILGVYANVDAALLAPPAQRNEYNQPWSHRIIDGEEFWRCGRDDLNFLAIEAYEVQE